MAVTIPGLGQGPCPPPATDVPSWAAGRAVLARPGAPAGRWLMRPHLDLISHGVSASWGRLYRPQARAQTGENCLRHALLPGELVGVWGWGVGAGKGESHRSLSEPLRHPLRTPRKPTLQLTVFRLPTRCQELLGSLNAWLFQNTL